MYSLPLRYRRFLNLVQSTSHWVIRIVGLLVVDTLPVAVDKHTLPSLRTVAPERRTKRHVLNWAVAQGNRSHKISVNFLVQFEDEVTTLDCHGVNCLGRCFVGAVLQFWKLNYCEI